MPSFDRRFKTISDLYDKLDWEGGFPDIIWNYGVSWNDLPPSTPDEIVRIWQMLEGMDESIRKVQGWLEDNADEGRDW